MFLQNELPQSTTGFVLCSLLETTHICEYSFRILNNRAGIVVPPEKVILWDYLDSDL